MDIALPNPVATPFLSDLRKLGKICHGARNLFRDEQLSIASAGEKVRKLIEDHIYSTGVDPKISPMDLLAANFKEKLNDHKSDRSKASEIENAIKHYININLEYDPEYYKSLSEKLESIIQNHKGKWEELVQLLMDLHGTMDESRELRAEQLGLTIMERPFYDILQAEIAKIEGIKEIDEKMHLKIKNIVQKLVVMMEEATKIVDFFNKENEQGRLKRDIKRAILEEFDNDVLVEPVTDRFMELAKVKFQ